MSRGKYGLPGIYNATPLTLVDEEASALATDISGRIILGTGSAIDVNAYSTIYNGQKTVGTPAAAEALASSQAVKSVTIKALAGNTNNVYVGDSSVDSSNGFVLAAGEAISLDIANLATVYLDVDTGGEGVCYLAIG